MQSAVTKAAYCRSSENPVGCFGLTARLFLTDSQASLILLTSICFQGHCRGLQVDHMYIMPIMVHAVSLLHGRWYNLQETGLDKTWWLLYLITLPFLFQILSPRRYICISLTSLPWLANQFVLDHSRTVTYPFCSAIQ